MYLIAGKCMKKFSNGLKIMELSLKNQTRLLLWVKLGCSPKCDVNIERKIFFLLSTDLSDLSDGGRAVSHRTSYISTISQIRILFATHDSSLFLITDFSDLSDRGRAVSHRTSQISTISQIRNLFATHDSSFFLITDFSDLSDGGRTVSHRSTSWKSRYVGGSGTLTL